MPRIVTLSALTTVPLDGDVTLTATALDVEAVVVEPQPAMVAASNAAAAMPADAFTTRARGALGLRFPNGARDTVAFVTAPGPQLGCGVRCRFAWAQLSGTRRIVPAGIRSSA